MSELNGTGITSSSLTRTKLIAGLDFSAVYRVAVLLTGSTRSAEEAVTRAIESMDLNAVTHDGLFDRTVIAATEMGPISEDPGFAPDEVELLPG